MFLLYNGNEGYSKEGNRQEQVHDIQWGMVRRNAARILRSLSHNSDAADTLEKIPFELWKASNNFGDQFELLYAKVPVQTYLKIELEADTYLGRTRYVSIAQALDQAGNPVRFIGMEAETGDSAAIPVPQIQTSSVAVTRALSDFEVLVTSAGGAVSGVDRIHTALHGYLKTICREASIGFPENADVTLLFVRIREQHPKFLGLSPAVDGTNVLRGLGRVVEALNPARNDHSLAHPSEQLLDEPEALLFVNAVKSLLHYLNAKLR
jgi:hypothetical protein